jgi:prepilin-type N-terminal cleavage/methylation domain-containing protein
MKRAYHIDRRNRARRAFSLTELLIALGIMAIGLSMAAALFPTAIKLNEQSGQDSIGTIIAENGLAVAQIQGAAIRAILAPDPNSGLIPIDGNNCTVFSSASGDPNLLLYRPDPNSTTTTRGFVILGRKLSAADPNGPAQLVIVSYDKRSSANTVTASLVTITGSPTTTVTWDATPPVPVPVGSPLILASTGAYARIIDANANGQDAVLDHAVPGMAADNHAFVIVENGVTGRSPAMTVVVSDVFLNP